MRKSLVGVLVMVLVMAARSGGVVAEDAILLPAPRTDGGPALATTLAGRASGRTFSDGEITTQELSDLLWSTAGVNRPDGKKVYPVSMNRQDMTLYVFTREGVYRYDPAGNRLEAVLAGDHRAATGTQPFVPRASVNLVYVQDMGLWNSAPEGHRGENWGFAHAGSMSQNASLYAAGQGWASVVRGLFDGDALKTLLGLPENQVVRLTQSIGPKG
ncbi:MAG: SagB/ThcOx family dehydrogenase [Planctomycetes bacterium]|nr:SagB/ThcOx family dehydrogenase [Planctomycetota bacterium]